MILSIDCDLITVDKLAPMADQTIETDMLRLDKIHPQISGNKWFKLKYYVDLALAQKKSGILTLGGAWSNHIHAVAAAAAQLNLHSIGIIRGERPASLSNTLLDAEALGMQLLFISREQYRHRESLFNEMAERFPDHLIVDEGGAGPVGVRGAADILNYVPHPHQYTHILAAVGTGTMLAGLCSAASSHQLILGISSLKGEDRISDTIKPWLPEEKWSQFRIMNQFHFGGYARHQPELIGFMNRFYEQNNIPTDMVYTGKLCYAWNQLCESGYFPSGSKLLLIHSGGLQGNRSLSKGKLVFQ